MASEKNSNKRLYDGQFKLETSNQESFIDLTNDTDDESSSSSKRVKSTLSGSNSKPSLSYPSRPPSTTTSSKSRLTTPLNEVFIKKTSRKPLFKSPPWQNGRLSDRRNAGDFSTTPTRTASSNHRHEAGIRDCSLLELQPRSTETPTRSKFHTAQVKTEHPNGLAKSHRSNEAESKTQRLINVSDNSHAVGNQPKVGPKPLNVGTYPSHKTPSTSRHTAIINPGDSVEDQLKGAKSNKSITPPLFISSRAVKQVSGRERSARFPVKAKNLIQNFFEDSDGSESPKPTSATHSVTPPRPRVVVEIRSSQQTPNSASRSLLDVFRQALPRPDAGEKSCLDVKVAQRSREAKLLAELKRDTSIAQSRASSVEEIFGSHGLSRYYDENENTERRKCLARLKAKKVTRSNMKLDWGTSPTESTFVPADVIPPREQAKCILDGRFKDRSDGVPLTFFNDRNDRQIDGKFQFVDTYIRRPGTMKTQPAPPEFGCSCSKGCDPTDPTCQCFKMVEGEHLVPYLKPQNGPVVLNPDFIDSVAPTRQEVFECNDMCACSKKCFNRVVQKGRTIPLEIFMTRQCGFGIRSPQPIEKGQFIDVYLGELLTTKAIEEYENASTEGSCSYVFSLDFFGPASYHIQGLHFGSPTRFINHSCHPNAAIFTVMMNHADQKVYKLAYFAIRDIPAMKEITFDYCPEAAHEGPWVPSPGEENDGVVRCLCGEKSCRGRIWPKKKVARREKRS